MSSNSLDSMVTSLSHEAKVRAFHLGTAELSAFVDQRVGSVLTARGNRTVSDEASLSTYMRLCLLARGLRELGHPSHFQMVAMATRCAFELWLDLMLLDGDPAAAQRYFDFVLVSRFSKALKLKNFLDQTPSVDASPHVSAVTLVNDAGARQRVENLKQQHGWNDRTEHWSSFDIATRAKRAGPRWEEIYRSKFFLHSYYVHSGAAGIAGLSQETLGQVFGAAHGLLQQCIVESTRIVATHFRLFDADPMLGRDLVWAGAATGRIILDEIGRSTGQ